jgi:protein-disulfide isomerase
VVRASCAFAFAASGALIACGSAPAPPPDAHVVTVDVHHVEAGQRKTLREDSGAPSPIAPDGDDALTATIDTDGFTARERAEWRAYLGELFAPCPDLATTVSACILEHRACKKCVRAATVVARLVHDGRSREDVLRIYRARYDPAAPRVIPLDGSPVLGPEGARVTIVELGDYECPSCGKAAPMVERILEAHPKDVRLVYKLLALRAHPHADAAARAAIAAGARGKFWEMHRLLYANQHALEGRDLERYARSLGLDVARFMIDMRAKAATERLAKDDALADSLGVTHTPSFFVDGRAWSFEEGTLEERVSEALE